MNALTCREYCCFLEPCLGWKLCGSKARVPAALRDGGAAGALHLFTSAKGEFMMRRLLLFCLLVLGLAVPAQAADPAVRMETSMGTIVLRLDAARAPATVANFVEYVKAGFYDGTIFHRVIPAFMIQGGGFTPDMRQKQTREPIANEADNGLPNVKYSIAMARTGAPHSATAQFFINTRDNAFLNFKSRDAQGWGYAVFGKVVRGQDVVDRIEKVATGSRGLHDDVPRDPVIIKKVTLIQ